MKAHIDFGMVEHLVLDNLAGLKAVAAHQQRHVIDIVHQQQAFLGGAVAAADHGHGSALVVGAVTRRAEVHSRADVVLLTRHAQAAITTAGGDQQRLGAVLCAIRSAHATVIVAAAQALNALRLQHFHAEAHSLAAQLIG